MSLLSSIIGQQSRSPEPHELPNNANQTVRFVYVLIFNIEEISGEICKFLRIFGQK
jgi:hypothetical protein